MHTFDYTLLANDYIDLLKSNNFAKNSQNDNFFTSRKWLGSKDRKLLSEIIYGTLRNLELCTFLRDNSKSSKVADSGITFQFVSLILANKINNSQLPLLEKSMERINDPNLIDIVQNSITSIAKFDIDNLNEQVRFSIPSPFYNLLQTQTKQHLHSFNNSAPTWLRYYMHFKPTFDILTQSSFTSLPYFYYSNDRINFENTLEHKKGHFEIQDIGSGIICKSIPINTTSLLDLCAGAGGKTLAAIDMLPNVKVTATDISLSRLQVLKQRLSRLNNSYRSRVETIDINQITHQTFDTVLIDAPCSGSGTIRRDPRLKYHLDEEKVISYSNLQFSLLERYKQHVKIGGHIIYATCSIFEIENKQVIEKFINSNSNFVLENIEFENQLYQYLYLNPEEFQSDGFFVAKLQRIS